MGERDRETHKSETKKGYVPCSSDGEVEEERGYVYRPFVGVIDAGIANRLGESCTLRVTGSVGIRHEGAAPRRH